MGRLLATFGPPSLAMALSLGSITDAAAQASPAPGYGGDFWSRAKLTGDWGGTRDQWAAKGFTVDLSTFYTLQGVPSGGLTGANNDVGNTVSDDLVFGLDTTKAGWWPGGSFKLRIENRAGVSALGKAGTLSPVNIDALFPNSLGNGDKSVFGVTELTYTQFFSRQFGVFAGLMNGLDADDNPIAGDSRRNTTFLNSAFLMSPVEAAEAPSVSPGVGAVYIATPDITGEFFVLGSQETATRNPFGNWDGTTLGTQWTLTHHIGDLPGGQVVGFIDAIDKSRTDIFQDPRVFLGNLITTRSVSTTRKNVWAVYYNAYQYIQGDQQKGWGPFLRAGFSDGDVNAVSWNLAVGLGGKGLIPSRDADGWGVGYYHIDLSNTSLLSAANLSSEDGGELFYNIALTPAIHTTFDTQWVASARPRQQTAWILGMRLGLDF